MSPFVLLQHLMPQLALTRFAGLVARSRGGALTTAIIRSFVKRYGVNMDEAQQPDIRAYKTFNEFFTRELRTGARPVASSRWICPVDGAVSQCARIEQGSLIQAKGHSYQVLTLLGDRKSTRLNSSH